jgi:hypothetical protein
VTDLRTVYTGGRVPTPAASQPAYRAWADVLLAIAADRRPSQLTPPLEVRATALMGSLVATEHLPAAHTVDGRGCAVARATPSRWLLSARGWRDGLRAHLVDIGLPEGEVDEHLLPCDAPMAPMSVPGARAAVEETRSDLLQAVTDYFRADIDAYLDSWQPLTAFDGSGDTADWEVVVPPTAVVSAG